VAALVGWCWADLGRKVGCEAKKASWATGEKAGLRGGFGPEAKKEKGKKKTFSYFQKSSQNLNSSTNLNSNKYKQCNSMSATVNSYSSLIN
jgi:hypothetical protein